MARGISKGRCRLCGGEYSKSGMTRHLQMCQTRKEAATEVAARKTRPVRLFHLVAGGRFAPMYWMHLEAPADATLADLDDFLRATWLECCGHMSAIETGGLRYSVVVDNEFGPDRNERSMSTKVSQVLTSPGQRLSYEYDFGSTTELTLRFISARTGIIGRPAARLLARNEPPVWKCATCDAPATLVCPFCMGEDNPFVCARHAREHTCADDESFLPVVNSPRMGVCGYTGEV